MPHTRSPVGDAAESGILITEVSMGRWLWLLWLPGCTWISSPLYDARMDEDGDGVDGLVDCNDRDSSASVRVTYWTDADGDGFGDPDEPTERCSSSPPAGTAANDADCDDTDPDVHAGQPTFDDLDGDGFGDPTAPRTVCASTPPPGQAAVDGDCDDTDDTVHPDAAEACNDRDDDCDGRIDDDDDDLDPRTAEVWFPDGDGDGYPDAERVDEPLAACDEPEGYASAATELDCDDTTAAISPADVETCGDDADNDCDGFIDEDGANQAEWYFDADGDKWPDSFEVITQCGDPQGTLMLVLEFQGEEGDGVDCAPGDPTRFPGAPDAWYDGVDSNCDDADDYDQDGDGHRGQLPEQVAGPDCDDTDPTIHPDAPEVYYDGIDADCDGADDYDQDRDGHASADHPDAQGLVGDDCDDADRATAPGAPDAWYDGIDSNCDGADDYDQDRDGDPHPSDPDGGGDCDDTDPSRSSLLVEVWYDGLDADCDGANDYDQDRDGHLGELLDGSPGPDCVDTDPTIYPEAYDAWYDGLDADCAGNDDFDRDGDGHADDDPSHGPDAGDDCDDGDPTISPSAVDTPDDGVDDNCNGHEAITCYFDVDDDGFGGLSVTSDLGFCGPNNAEVDGDCDDFDPQSYPGAPELCDDIDQDCDDDLGEEVASAVRRDGTVVALVGDELLSSAVVERVDLCGGTWGLTLDWNPADGDVDIVAHDAYPRPLLDGTEPVVTGGGPGRNQLEIRGVAFGHQAPLVDLVDLVGDNVERPTLVLEDIDVLGVTANRLLSAEELSVVLEDVVIEDGAFGRGAVHQDGGFLILLDSAIRRSTRADDAIALGGGLVHVDDAYVEMVSTHFEDNPTRPLAATDSTVELNETSWVGNEYVVTGEATRGGAIHVVGTTLRDTSSTFTGNAASELGGAVWGFFATVGLEKTTFAGNGRSLAGDAVSEGGALHLPGSLLVANDVVFTDNEADSASAVYQSQFIAVLGGVVVDESGAGSPGPALVFEGTELLATDLALQGLATDPTESCLVIRDAEATLDGLDPSGCPTRAVDVIDGTALTVRDSTFDGLRSVGGGGAVRALGIDTLRIEGSSFLDNHCAADGLDPGDGGAVLTDAGTVWLQGSSFERNTSAASGGGLWAGDALVHVCETDLLDNVAGDDGGGLVAASLSSPSSEDGPEICTRSSLVAGNTASGDGGGIRVSAGPTTLGAVDISDNLATDGGGVHTAGALSVVDPPPTLSANEATGSGGGIYLTTTGPAPALGATAFLGNDAPAGSALFVTGIGWVADGAPETFSATSLADETSGITFDAMSGSYDAGDGRGPQPTADEVTGSLVLDEGSSKYLLHRTARHGTWSLSVTNDSFGTTYGVQDDLDSCDLLARTTTTVSCDADRACECL